MFLIVSIIQLNFCKIIIHNTFIKLLKIISLIFIIFTEL